jgi:chloride channel protein, CIC family
VSPRPPHPRAALAAAAVGVVAALAVLVFKAMIAGAEWVAIGWRAGAWANAEPPWVLLVPVAGGLLVGAILHFRRLPHEPGHGVAEVIEAVTLGTEEFPERETPVKATVAALSLGAGASLGPEDPAVEIGGSVGHFLARTWRMPHDSVQAMVAAGASAGLSAAFQAPLAAAVFAVEVFSLRLLSRTTALVVTAALAAYLVTVLLAPGAEPRIPPHAMTSVWQLPLAVGLGLVAGALSAAHIRLTYTLEIAVVRWRAVPRWLKPALGGLALGATGLGLPELLGIGYAPLEAIAAGQPLALSFLLALAAGKLVLMAVSFASGFLGGFFAPSMFIGAALGAAYGMGAQAVLPGLDLPPALFALAGMAAVLAGSVRAPFTAILLILALSGGVTVAPLLLAAAWTAVVVSRRLERHSLYTYGITHPAAPSRARRRRARPQSDVTGGLDSAE